MVYFLIAGEHSIYKITESIFATRGNSLIFAKEHILLANTTNKQIWWLKELSSEEEDENHY